MSLAIWFTLAGCFAAAYCDVRTRRIPNWLTGALALAAVIVHAFGGWNRLADRLGRHGRFDRSPGTFVYSRGGIGGGDIKLAIAGAGMLSYPLCVPFLLYTAIGGGVLAVLYLIFAANARPSLSRAF